MCDPGISCPSCGCCSTPHLPLLVLGGSRGSCSLPKEEAGEAAGLGHIQPHRLLFCAREHSTRLQTQAHGHHPCWESWGAAVLAANLSSCTCPVLRKAGEVVRAPIPFFTSENALTVPIPIPEAVAAFVPGSLNGCFGWDGDGETPPDCQSTGLRWSLCGARLSREGAAGVPGKAAPGSIRQNRRLRLPREGRSCGLLWPGDRAAAVLRELWGASSCQFAGSLENTLVSNQFGQKPNVGRNQQKIPADQIPPSPLAQRGPSPQNPPSAGAQWGGHGGRRHSRTRGSTRHHERSPRAPCPERVAGDTWGRALQR